MTPKASIVAVVGPTASGKTALAVSLAERLCGEVVSCDSMQVYRGMDIGTAKPTTAERRGVPHHMIDILDPGEPFSASDYASAAVPVVDGILARGRLPIFCGGTGLYLDAFLRGGMDESADSPEIREHLEERVATEGADSLYRELCRIDPESGAATHPNNVRRVIRALEIYYATGVTKSELDRRSRETEPRYRAIVIGLRFRDRAELYSRIDARVDMMISDGLEDEVARLCADGVFERSRTASQAIGYKEFFGVLRGQTDRVTAIEELKRATRRYAKRQMTWFSAHPEVNWIDRDSSSTDAELLERALEIVKKCE